MGPSLTQEHKSRYSRQLAIPEIGVAGQVRLGECSVLIVGLGGLGSVSTTYLAAAGVGHLRIVDGDHVALENLNRQFLHNTLDIGRPKVESAWAKLHSLNPECHVEPVHAALGDENGLALSEGCDLILDATDNLATRHVLNRISLARRIPFLYGGIHGWNGTAATFIPGKTCCLACLFPSAEPAKEKTVVPALGPAVGVIGSIQALEALRILLGLEPSLTNRLLDFRGEGLRFRIVEVGKDPECLQCGRAIGG